MREILFRGKRKKDGEWVEGNLFIPVNPDTPTQICMGTYTMRICHEVIPETVGEFTGLNDKKGKKIFEGDIVKFDDGTIYSIELINGVYRVIDKQGFCSFFCSQLLFVFRSYRQYSR